MEFGNETNHQSTKCKFLVTASKGDGKFEVHWESAVKELLKYKIHKEKEKGATQKQRKIKRQKLEEKTNNQEDPQETRMLMLLRRKWMPLTVFRSLSEEHHRFFTRPESLLS